MSDACFVSSTGQEIPIIITTKRGLRNITLRPKTAPVCEIHISKPFLVSEKQAFRFIEQKRKWLENIFNKAPKKKTLKVGDEIDILGRKVLIQNNPNSRLNQYITGDYKDVLIVGGSPDLLESRVRSFVKKVLLDEIKKLVKSTPKEYWPARISLKDTCSRWGSCSTSGTMSFSWRLAFAPYDVMRYVVMHEVAHRKYMDHSADFWHQVSVLYGFGVERAKRWLNQNGASLHTYL